jgi:hypothetical protein
MLFSASGLNLPESTNPSHGVIRPQKGLTINDLFALKTNFMVWGNYNRLNINYKLVMYVENLTEYDFVFRVFNQEIEIVAGTIPQWIEYNLRTIFNDGDLNYLSMNMMNLILNLNLSSLMQRQFYQFLFGGLKWL